MLFRSLYDAKYRCKVIKQNTDGNLDLLPDPNFDLINNGFVNVPIVYPFPGMKIKVSNGAVCFVGFANGDPQYPRVFGWEDSGEPILVEMVHTNAAEAARKGDSVDIGNITIAANPMTGAITGTYTPPMSASIPIVGGVINLNAGKITTGSTILKIGT